MQLHIKSCLSCYQDVQISKLPFYCILYYFADSISALADSLISEVEREQLPQLHQQHPDQDDGHHQQQLSRRRDSSSNSSGNSNTNDSVAYSEHIRSSSYALLQQAASR